MAALAGTDSRDGRADLPDHPNNPNRPNNQNPPSVSNDTEPKLMWCVKCQTEQVADGRVKAGFITCLRCGEADAKRVRFTVAPAYHKGPYTVHSDKTMLRYISRPGRGSDY
jgi:hypothetical protein